MRGSPRLAMTGQRECTAQGVVKVSSAASCAILYARAVL